MLEDTSTCGEISLTLQPVGSERRRYRLRACFFVLLVLTLLICCYVNFSEVSDFWPRTVHVIENTTYPRVVSTETFLIISTAQTATTIVHTSDKTISPSGQPVVTMAEQCKAATRYHVAYPCPYHYIVNEPERCQKDNPFLVLMVPVAPSNREARDAVRSTWGSEKVVNRKVVSLFFMLGQSSPHSGEEQQQKLLQESEEHHDILQSNFLDSYNNLTIKTMVIMEWLASHCQNAFYAMKIDSDMFLNINTLVSMLLQAPKKNYMTGLVTRGAIVSRDPTSKWYFPKDVFPEDIYPTYTLGLGYVFSIDLPGKLVKGAKHNKAVYVEDVNLGLIMRYLGIAFTDPANTGLFNLFPVPYNRCRYSKLIATTTNSLQEQVNSWKDLQKPGPLCVPLDDKTAHSAIA